MLRVEENSCVVGEEGVRLIIIKVSDEISFVCSVLVF